MSSPRGGDPLDVKTLINNAGGNTPQPIDQITDEVWDHFVRTFRRRTTGLLTGSLRHVA